MIEKRKSETKQSTRIRNNGSEELAAPTLEFGHPAFLLQLKHRFTSLFTSDLNPKLNPSNLTRSDVVAAVTTTPSINTSVVVANLNELALDL